jgi:hypothetical protein
MPGVRKSLLIGALALTVLAPPAHGQSGNGLYKPFPEANSIDRSKDFVKDLETADGAGLNLSEKELEEGVLVSNRSGKTRPAPELDQGASDRAAGGSGLGPVVLWAAALGLLGLAATGVARIPFGPTPRRT